MSSWDALLRNAPEVRSGNSEVGSQEEAGRLSAPAAEPVGQGHVSSDSSNPASVGCRGLRVGAGGVGCRRAGSTRRQPFLGGVAWSTGHWCRATGRPPVEWSESTNIRWKVELPGLGSATPVVWDDRVFVLTAVPTGAETGGRDGLFTRLRRREVGAVGASRVQRFVIMALDRRDGRVIWDRLAREELPHEGTHETGSWASPSALTDGDVVCAFFGSRGLYCYDLDGAPLWDTDLGDMRIRLGFGEGASPTLYRDLLIVLWDHEGDSFIVAFDKRTGRERWRTPRDEMTSWSTPLVVEHGDGAQVVTSATDAVRSYDVATGRLLWQDEGVTLNAIPLTGGGRRSRLRDQRVPREPSGRD